MLAERDLTPIQRLQAAQQRLPANAAFSGLTAAWLHNLDAVLANPIEATVALGTHVRSRSGIVLHRSLLPAGDVITVGGFRTTSLLRTLRDLCARSSLTEAVVFLDVGLHTRRVNLEVLQRYVATSGRTRGIAMLRRALTHAEPKAESPMESRLRMLLVLAGPPRPEAQVRILDAAGRFAGRVDLYYREKRLGIEYDGDTHTQSLAADNRRQNRLLESGVRLLRFTASDIYQHPEDVVSRVRRMLSTP